METIADDHIRYSATEAIERLVDWVRNLDTDELAKAVSQHAPPRYTERTPVVVFDDMGGDEESAPYLEGKRLKVIYVLDDEPRTQGLI